MEVAAAVAVALVESAAGAPVVERPRWMEPAGKGIHVTINYQTSSTSEPQLLQSGWKSRIDHWWVAAPKGTALVAPAADLNSVTGRPARSQFRARLVKQLDQQNLVDPSYLFVKLSQGLTRTADVVVAAEGGQGAAKKIPGFGLTAAERPDQQLKEHCADPDSAVHLVDAIGPAIAANQVTCLRMKEQAVCCFVAGGGTAFEDPGKLAAAVKLEIQELATNRRTQTFAEKASVATFPTVLVISVIARMLLAKGFDVAASCKDGFIDGADKRLLPWEEERSCAKSPRS